MGDRISIQFVNGDEKSVVLFSHHGGKQFLKEAIDYIKKLKREVSKNEGCYPLDRLEPSTVMVDFIREMTKGLDRVKRNLYLGKDENEGDNSDNGHFIIDALSGRAFKKEEGLILKVI